MHTECPNCGETFTALEFDSQKCGYCGYPNNKEDLETTLEECPNCSSIWAPGSEEWEFQQCDCCGYPDNDFEGIGESDDFDYPDNDYEEEDFPNGSLDY